MDWKPWWDSYGPFVVAFIGLIAVVAGLATAWAQRDVAQQRQAEAERRQDDAESRQDAAQARQDAAETRQDAAEEKQRLAEETAKQALAESAAANTELAFARKEMSEARREASLAQERAAAAERETARTQLRVEELRAENLEWARALAPRLFVDQGTAAIALKALRASAVIEHTADKEAERTAQQIWGTLNMAGWRLARRDPPSEAHFFDGVEVRVIRGDIFDARNASGETAAEELVRQLERTAISARNGQSIDDKALTAGTVLIRVGLKPNPAYDIDRIQRPIEQRPRFDSTGSILGPIIFEGEPEPDKNVWPWPDK